MSKDIAGAPYRIKKKRKTKLKTEKEQKRLSIVSF